MPSEITIRIRRAFAARRATPPANTTASSNAVLPCAWERVRQSVTWLVSLVQPKASQGRSENSTIEYSSSGLEVFNNAETASAVLPISFRILRLESTTRTIDTGLSLWLNERIFCSIPASRRRNAPASRPLTGRPAWSRTLALMSTRLEATRKVDPGVVAGWRWSPQTGAGAVKTSTVSSAQSPPKCLEYMTLNASIRRRRQAIDTPARVFQPNCCGTEQT